MAFPRVFANLSGPIPLSFLDDDFNALSSSSGSSNIGFLQDGTGAVAQTVDVKLKTSVSVTDFMSAAQIADARAGTSSIDCSAAAQSAITYAIANNFDLEIPYRILLSSAVNIDRQVDGAAFDKYFKIFTKTGGGFYTTGLAEMFTSSIAFTTAPVSQLVMFDGINFESDTAATRYVLKNGRFLRTRFFKCSFSKILACNSTIYTQSIQFAYCNMRRGSGAFWTSTAQSYDFKFLGNIVESWTGNFMSLSSVVGGAVMGSLLEGISGTAIVYNGAAGFAIHGNYFETNGKDIDGTGATAANAVSLHGNFFTHVNPADYSVIWGSTLHACVSSGNYHTGSMHNVSAGADLFIEDQADVSVANNTTTPLSLCSPIMQVTSGAALTLKATSTTAANFPRLTFFHAGNDTYDIGGGNDFGFYPSGSATASVKFFTGGGINVGVPTGGNKGVGTANFAADIYKNNTAYTNPDYVLEHWATGTIKKYAHKEGAKNYKGRMSLDRLRAYVKRYLHLPGFGQKASHGAFSGADQLLATIEELTLHIFDLAERLRTVERSLSKRAKQ